MQSSAVDGCRRVENRLPDTPKTPHHSHPAVTHTRHHDRKTQHTPNNPTTPIIVLKTGDGVQPRPWVRIPPPPLTAPQTPWLSGGLRGVESDSRQEPPPHDRPAYRPGARGDRRFSRSRGQPSTVCTGCCQRTCAGGVAGERPETTVPTGRGRGRTRSRPMYRRTPSILAGPCGRARPRSASRLPRPGRRPARPSSGRSAAGGSATGGRHRIRRDALHRDRVLPVEKKLACEPFPTSTTGCVDPCHRGVVVPAAPHAGAVLDGYPTHLGWSAPRRINSVTASQSPSCACQMKSSGG